ncbi:MAG: A/G-specific adenine glycosylase [Bryobacteraceae bacterium]|nr:A/G-specific adenine glycosylase [Bryobacteraceae bacterium]
MPWRETRDPWRILVSEVMLQQTRVAAVIPYYERFLARFPDAASLAAADEADLLALWSGLGYYSRARNLQRAAKAIVEQGGFPRDYLGIRALPGVGDYTAAAVGSIAFGLPYAVLDGNVLRVAARYWNDAGDIASQTTRARLREKVQAELPPKRAGDYNQAVMELGATVCLPRNPKCLLCPLEPDCEARSAGTAEKLPNKAPKTAVLKRIRCVLWVEKKAKVLMTNRDGFWELPDESQLPGAIHLEEIGIVRHAIMRTSYTISVIRARLARVPGENFRWIDRNALSSLPVSTIARKSLRLGDGGGS